MQFVLAGFRQFDNVRRYYFDFVTEDRKRQQVAVSADLNLIRRYRIPLQDLPLLCRRLLDGCTEVKTIIFTESDMVRYASEREAAANALLQRRRAHRPPVSTRVGQAWRGAPAPQAKN